MAAGAPWTDQENRSLLKGRIHSVSWETLAADLRRTIPSCKKQLQLLDGNRTYATLTARIPHKRRVTVSARAQVKSIVATPEILDRDRRNLLRYVREETDATATFFGDPLPGYSALDRKLEGVR